jgi:hypothetical protein
MRGLELRDRKGVATPIIVLAVILVIAVGAAGAYFVFSSRGSSSGSSSTNSKNSSSAGTSHSTSRTSVSSSLSTSSSSPSGLRTYAGTFAYTQPLGPFGINSTSSGKISEWNSTESSSGTFVFSINPANYTGTGSGRGTMIVTTRGYCTGSVTVPYTFTIEATDILGGNITVGFLTANPESAMVQLTCQGPTTGFNQANNPVSFLSVYPNLVSISSAPKTVSQPPITGISYSITITPTN